MDNREQLREELKQYIKKNVFITSDQEQFGFANDRQDNWIFDFRRIIMNGKVADVIAEIFYQQFQSSYPFQVSTLEIGGVPIATSILNKLYAKGHHDANAFFIRKSRKKTGLFRMIEGTVEPDKKIILVDDVMNSGSSMWRQIEVLEELGHKVVAVWSLLRFRDEEYYTRFHLRGIKVYSVFELNDLTEELGEAVKNLPSKKETRELTMPFEVKWVFKSDNPFLGWVCDKSRPILDAKKIYFGSDYKYMWAINQEDGSVAWKFQIGTVARKKAIFSDPVLHNGSIIFGAYDGNVYCLDTATGALRWTCIEADWVGSSPALAPELDMVFIGLEYGVFSKMGGLLALNASTGKPVWIDRSHKALTHCSPEYIPEHQEVVMGSNDGIVRLHDALSGEKKWEFTTFGGASYDPVTWGGRVGFSNGDIKEGFVYYPKRDFIIFGSIDGFLYVLDRATGHLVTHVKCEFGIFPRPYIYKDKVYFSSADKNIRCLDLETLELVFKVCPDKTRIFCRPTVINDRLYVGTNAARLHELDPETGEMKGYFQANERITNSVIYNPETDTYFLPTYANEILALKRKKDV